MGKATAMEFLRLHRWSASFVLATCLAGIAPLSAQEVEAYRGQPYGVARVVINLSGADAERLVELNAIQLTARGVQIHYPAIVRPPARRIVEGIFGNAFGLGPGRIEAYFLFTGDAPIELTVTTPAPRTVTVLPQPSEPGHQRLFQEWWRQHDVAARDRRKNGDYPLIVENYLAATLSRRFNLPLPDSISDTSADKASRQAMNILLGSEAIREAVLIETLTGSDGGGQAADEPLPDPIPWPAVEYPQPAGEIEIEPIANRVPEDCFYVRFGGVRNFLWVRHLLDEYSGDIGRMVTLQGRNDELNKRLEQQIGLRYTVLLDLAGEQIISDMALIGRDAFFREGAAVGMLFQARSAPVLGFALQNELGYALTRNKEHGATREMVEIAGRRVPFFSTPDNRLRAFYATDGNFTLVTSSRHMVERFYEVREGAGSLGASDAFRHARSLRPVSSDDTVFVYISPKFLQGLLSPQYQVELRRRLQATTDIEVYELARLAAEAEGISDPALEELVRSGFLPPNFTERADGSKLVVEGDRVTDSLRGARGTFLPIPDVPLKGATARERNRAEELAQYHATDWRRMEPLLIGVRREAVNDSGLERISIEARVSPFSSDQYGGYATLLADPVRRVVTPLAEDLIHVQAHVQGGEIMDGVRPHLLFVGVQNAPPLLGTASGGLMEVLRIVRAAPGYVGSVPQAGFLDRLPIQLGTAPDQFGFSSYPFGLWRRQWADYSALSFDRFILDVLPQRIRTEPAPDPAQARWRVGDIANSRLAPWVNRLAWDRVRTASHGNAQLLNLVTQQLRVPAADARTELERLLDTKLVCALGGDYKLVQRRDGLNYWASDRSGIDVSEYQTPLLEWFRGEGQGTLTREEDQLVLQGSMLMQRKKSADNAESKLLELFGLPKKKDRSATPDPEKAPGVEKEAPK